MKRVIALLLGFCATSALSLPAPSSADVDEARLITAFKSRCLPIKATYDGLRPALRDAKALAPAVADRLALRRDPRVTRYDNGAISDAGQTIIVQTSEALSKKGDRKFRALTCEFLFTQPVTSPLRSKLIASIPHVSEDTDAFRSEKLVRLKISGDVATGQATMVLLSTTLPTLNSLIWASIEPIN